jgi:hypothetical protein
MSEILNTNDLQIPEEFICPITLEIMYDPVLCEDGHTYERSAILLLRDSVSPLTRTPINRKNLIPNRALKETINTYKNNLQNKIIENNITDSISYNNYMFELKIKSENEMYLRIIDTHEELLYDAIFHISNLNNQQIKEFYSMIIKSLNKELNYHIIINNNNDKIQLNFSYITESVNLQEDITLLKNNSHNAKEYILNSKIKKLEEQLIKFEEEEKFLDSIIYPNIVINEEDNESYEITSNNYFEMEQKRLQQLISQINN